MSRGHSATIKGAFLKKNILATAFSVGLLTVCLGQPSNAAVASDGGSVVVADSSAWKVVTSDQSRKDVYIDRNGKVLPQDANGNPLDNPDGYESQPATPAAAPAPTDAQAAAIGPCTPYSGRDYPHRSSTGFAASGHGWWDKGDCSNSLAKVYNCLYMKHLSDGYWYQKDCSPVETLKPGGGSSYRTTARRDCATAEYRSWRNHVDVDVVDEWDTGENPMWEQSVACRT